MPSFDIVSKVDPQTIDNVMNVVRKEILNRYDFNGSQTTIELDKKELSVLLITETEMRIQAIEKVLLERAIKQHLDPQCFDFSKPAYPSGATTRKEIKIKQGIEKEVAKKMVKDIKDSGMKVQASIMDDLVRVTAKKIDDLQAVIALCRQGKYGLPLQFVNMKN